MVRGARATGSAGTRDQVLADIRQSRIAALRVWTDTLDSEDEGPYAGTSDDMRAARRLRRGVGVPDPQSWQSTSDDLKGKIQSWIEQGIALRVEVLEEAELREAQRRRDRGEPEPSPASSSKRSLPSARDQLRLLIGEPEDLTQLSTPRLVLIRDAYAALVEAGDIAVEKGPKLSDLDWWFNDHQATAIAKSRHVANATDKNFGSRFPVQIQIIVEAEAEIERGDKANRLSHKLSELAERWQVVFDATASGRALDADVILATMLGFEPGTSSVSNPVFEMVDSMSDERSSAVRTAVGHLDRARDRLALGADATKEAIALALESGPVMTASDIASIAEARAANRTLGGLGIPSERFAWLKPLHAAVSLEGHAERLAEKWHPLLVEAGVLAETTEVSAATRWLNGLVGLNLTARQSNEGFGYEQLRLNFIALRLLDAVADRVLDSGDHAAMLARTDLLYGADADTVVRTRTSNGSQDTAGLGDEALGFLSPLRSFAETVTGRMSERRRGGVSAAISELGEALERHLPRSRDHVPEL